MNMMTIQEFTDFLNEEPDPIGERNNKLLNLVLGEFFDKLPEVEDWEPERRWHSYKNDTSNDADDMICVEISYEGFRPSDLIVLGEFTKKIEKQDFINDIFLYGGNRGMIVLTIVLKEDDIEKLNEIS